MNTEILTKCLKELGEQSPRIDYVRGMLETLIAMQPKAYNNEETARKELTKTMPPTHAPGEAGLLDAMAMANLEKIRNIAAKSVETS